MIKNFLDADEDDSLITKESTKKESENAKEFEDFAQPFSEIESQEKDLPEVSEPLIEEFEEKSNESNEPQISELKGEIPVEPVSETPDEAKSNEFSEPKFDKSSGEKFWEKQLEALKTENYHQPNDLQADDFQDDDFETIVRPKSEQKDFEFAEIDAPVNFETPSENEAADFEPQIKEEQIKEKQTGFVLPRLENNQPFAETLNEIKNESDGDFNGETNGVRRREDAPLFSQSPYHSETPEETIRRSGLAYAAAIALFGSIVFTLILGWFADLLLGTSPWGKVGGIILGAIVGFIQFFRTTSDIFKNKQ